MSQTMALVVGQFIVDLLFFGSGWALEFDKAAVVVCLAFQHVYLRCMARRIWSVSPCDVAAHTRFICVRCLSFRRTHFWNTYYMMDIHGPLSRINPIQRVTSSHILLAKLGRAVSTFIWHQKLCVHAHHVLCSVVHLTISQ